MSKTGIGLALLAGVAIGAGIGILMAPDKGSETRKKIKGGVDDAKADLKGKYDSLKKKARHNAEEAYADIVTDMGSKSDEVISFLETKLAALKREVSKY